MNQSSRDDTLQSVRPSLGPGRGAVSSQSSRDKQWKRSLPGTAVRREGRAISRGFEPGAVLPDFTLPDQDGVKRRLSELQGDMAMVLSLGRGEHCPRERQHHRELIWFHRWYPMAFTSLVTVLPNDLHDVFKLRASTGAFWTYLSNADLEVQRALEIEEYTDVHHAATVPHTLVLAPGLVVEKASATCSVGPSPTSTPPPQG